MQQSIQQIKRVYFLVLALRWLSVGLVLPIFVLFMQSRGINLMQLGLIMGALFGHDCAAGTAHRRPGRCDRPQKGRSAGPYHQYPGRRGDFLLLLFLGISGGYDPHGHGSGAQLRRPGCLVYRQPANGRSPISIYSRRWPKPEQSLYWPLAPARWPAARCQPCLATCRIRRLALISPFQPPCWLPCASSLLLLAVIARAVHEPPRAQAEADELALRVLNPFPGSWATRCSLTRHNRNLPLLMGATLVGWIYACRCRDLLAASFRRAAGRIDRTKLALWPGHGHQLSSR